MHLIDIDMDKIKVHLIRFTVNNDQQFSFHVIYDLDVTLFL